MPFVKHTLSVLIELEPDKVKREIVKMIKAHGGEVTLAARDLGVTRRTLDRWVIKLGLGTSAAAWWAKLQGVPAHGEKGVTRASRLPAQKTRLSKKRQARPKKD